MVQQKILSSHFVSQIYITTFLLTPCKHSLHAWSYRYIKVGYPHVMPIVDMSLKTSIISFTGMLYIYRYQWLAGCVHVLFV